MEQMIPSPDIIPLPAPAWIFLILLLITFTVHVIFMNMLFGGALLAVFGYIRSGKDARHALLTRKIYTFLPVVIAFTVNFGVAPLLFVQVIYGHLFYSSSILLGWFWFAVIPLVILGYYGTYLLRFRWNRVARFRLPLLAAVAAVFTVIPFIFVNNLSLLQIPDTWISHYFTDPSGGTLNWTDPAVYPRFLHMLLGALAVAGGWVLVIGARGRTGDRNWSQWAVEYGARIFIGATLLNILVGVWFLLAAPHRVTVTYLGGRMDATLTFAAALILTVVMFYLVFRIRKTVRSSGIVYGAGGILIAVVFLMILMRQFMREAYLEPAFTLDQLAVRPQWGAVGLFFGIFVLVMVPALAWLLKTAIHLKKPGEY